jgi:hypothetical protein
LSEHAARKLDAIDPELVRCAVEGQMAERLLASPGLAALRQRATEQVDADPARVRRLLMAQGLRLTEGMAPEAWAAARAAADVLGTTEPLELYQAAGTENAGIHLVKSPIMLEIRGSLIALLDAGSAISVFGHELGHYLAHGPNSAIAATHLLARYVLNEARATPEAHTASRLLMASELTADRFGLLATQDLTACLRAEMATATGLPADAIGGDTAAYLEQCKALVAELTAEAGESYGTTHPEHGIRAWALWLFSETETYQQITQQGPGTRKLAEVDAQIAQVLGVAAVPGVVDSVDVHSPTPELHECALASAALVALADGQLAEEEVAAIERVFGSLVADWQRYLVYDNALEAFADTGAVVMRGGPPAQRTVFHLIAHVLVADGAVKPSEIEMVCAIGDALHCGPMFRAMLEPVLRAAGVEVPDLRAMDRIIPMPARAAESRYAVEVLLRGLTRRGGGELSLAVLLRLLGDPAGSEASRQLLAATFTDLDLIPALDLRTVPSDQPFEVRLGPVAEARRLRAAKPPADAGDPARVRLVRALSRLRDQLVSGDGRSPSVRLRQTRTGRSVDLALLDVVSEGHGARTLALVEAGEPVRLLDGKEVGTHEGARLVAAELVALDREAKARAEETGARDLYVGAPLLTGVVSGYLLRAPLLLHPYDLVREDHGYRLARRADEGCIVNQALVRVLFNKLDRTFPDDLPDRLDEAATEGLDAVVALLESHGVVAHPEPGPLRRLEPRDEELEAWASGQLVREPCAVLGFFPQSASDMIQDYAALIAAAQSTEGEIGKRLGAAGALLPADLREVLAVPDVPPDTSAPVQPVVMADPSQLEVVRRSRQERVLVVDGPPGTGKSQVIVNLVADALARGRSVAVVCEKRAAIDVVAQRLDGVGMRHLLAVVHDTHEDRRPLFDQIVARLSEGLQRAIDPVAHARTHDETTELTRTLQSRRAALAHPVGERTVGQLHQIASALSTEAPVLADPLATLAHPPARELAERISREARCADLHAADSVWRSTPERSRPSLADVSEAQLGEVERSLRAGLITASALAPHGASHPEVDVPRLLGARAALRAAADLRPALQDRAHRELIAAWLRAGEQGPAVSALRQALTAWGEADRWLPAAPHRVTTPLPTEAAAALPVVDRWSGSWLRWFVWGWWSARATVRAALASWWPEQASAAVDLALTQQIRGRDEAATAWRALDALITALDVHPTLESSIDARRWLGLARSVFDELDEVLTAETALRRLGAWPSSGRPADLEPWLDVVDARCQHLHAARAHLDAVQVAVAALPSLGALPDGPTLRHALDAWLIDAARVATSDRNLHAASAIFPDARALAEGLAARPEPSVDRWRDAVEAGWAEASLAATELRKPELRVLDRTPVQGELPEVEAKLAAALRSARSQAVEQILARADQVALLTEALPEARARRNPMQKIREQLLREASKKRHMLSLRGLVREFADKGLLEALPVWLLSPETMAVLFPGKPVFDLVIIDEASQCTVEKGFAALVRGHRAVVAGDDRQMPPTAFFALGTPGEDEVAIAEEVVASDALVAESLLVLARERCAHSPLTWHYRCREEELIAFSNHAMYGGHLFTVPSVATHAATPALRWVHVHEGAYDKGVNTVEAAQVVEVLRELITRPTPPSLGVVTFNIQQRKAVLDAIDQRREADPAFAAAWDKAATQPELDQRPFVKNLESVQGDERDVIVFSLGHAPSVRQRGPLAGQPYVPARFGPLGLAGGERRLNVAVSRARAEMVIVASFEPAMLTVGESRHEGPKLLKAFLEFAWELSHTRRLQADRVLHRVRGGGLLAGRRRSGASLPGIPSLAAQLAARLEALGHHVVLDVGSSDFRVPLAVADPNDPGRYLLGVLCDGGEHEGDVVERHVHEPAVLHARGWRLLRVDARAWHRRPADVLRRLEQALGQPAPGGTSGPA